MSRYRDTERLVWEVPPGPQKRLEDYCRERYGRVEGYQSKVTERAMEEYVDRDGSHPGDLAEAEAAIEAVLSELGAAGDESSDEKKLSESAGFSNQGTDTFTAYVEEDTLAAFREVADDAAGSLGRVLGRAIWEYTGGGRGERLLEKAREARDAAESVDLDDNRTRTERICDRVTPEDADPGDEFTLKDEDLLDAIHDVAGQDDEATPPTVRKYRRTVTDRLDLIRHPYNDEVWCTPGVAQNAVPDGTPEVCWKSVEDLDTDERRDRIALELGREVATGERGARVPAPSADLETVWKDYFDHEVSKNDAEELMHEVGELTGFRAKHHKGEFILAAYRDYSPKYERKIHAYAEGVPLEEYRDDGDESDEQDAESNDENETDIPEFLRTD